MFAAENWWALAPSGHLDDFDFVDALFDALPPQAPPPFAANPPPPPPPPQPPQFGVHNAPPPPYDPLASRRVFAPQDRPLPAPHPLSSPQQASEASGAHVLPESSPNPRFWEARSPFFKRCLPAPA